MQTYTKSDGFGVPAGVLLAIETDARGYAALTIKIQLSGGDPFGTGMTHPEAIYTGQANPFDVARIKPKEGDLIGFLACGAPVKPGQPAAKLDKEARASIFAMLRQRNCSTQTA